MKLLLLALFACFCLSVATTGVDVSALTSQSAFGCLKSNGYNFAIVRGYRSTGAVDSNVVASVKNAWAAGFAHVDVYMFPCYSCGNPASQVRTLYNYLNSNGVKYGMIWFDIEGTQYWSTSTSSNSNFFASMVTEARSLGISIGVYTSKSQWQPIMGTYTGGSPYPLWYAHYDNSPSFSDFSAFNGWTKPAIKQYAGDVTLCGVGIDKNWYP